MSQSRAANDTIAVATKRPCCPNCLRPQRACICQWIAPIAHTVEVLVLQHPLEVGNAKGSARLLHLSLPRSRLITGEVFSEQDLQTHLHAPFEQQKITGPQQGQRAKHPLLLYPDTPDDHAMGMTSTPIPDEAQLREPAQLRLVVVDGTWRKSRKMLYLNPLLQALPRLALRMPPPSQYLIRKAHRADQLSTLEATCYALMQLEKNDEKYQPLLDAFAGFVTQQCAYTPHRKTGHPEQS